MTRVDADRNLLLGILAQQMDFVTRDALFAAMNAWIVRKETPLGALLVERGDLANSRWVLLEALVDEHVRAHGGDPARSLQALSSVGAVAEDLGRLPDADIQASVDHLRTRYESIASPVDSLATRVPTSQGALTSWNGRFRVVRPHASGGLGVVSVALDDELDREVAFKEIKDRYADEDGHRARFVLEAEITGKLEHPGIIPIYGLGHDPSGRPFYAMRLIRGDSLADAINRYHDPAGPYLDPTKRSLQLRELLARYLDVCNAIAYAHSRGVLHRDLKPGNVMLGPFGETLVVDWGLALPLDHVPEGHDSTQGPVKSTKADSASLPREHGQVVGTPAYMPPEQAEGAIDKLGPRSDVYGLGAILYDLLTGKHPIEGTTLEEILRHVGQGEIKPPRQVRPEVPAGLEAVCLKALSLRPEGRYPTPRALAADIKAWLADEPVSARREPFADRARRWAKRNRTAVTAAAASLLVGLVGLGVVAVVLVVSNIALDKQRRRAEDREAQAIAAVKRFGDVITNEPALKNTPALAPLRRRLLNEPLAFFRALRDSLQADRDTRAESLARLASASTDLGKLTEEIGDLRDALIAHGEALAIRKALASANPAVIPYQSDLAGSHNNIGLLLNATGKRAEALKAHESALAIQQTLAEANPAVAQYKSELAGSHNNIGLLLSATGKPAEALKAHESALAIRQSLAEANPAVIPYQNDLAASHNNTGLLLIEIGKPVEALKAYQAALNIQEALVRANPAADQFQSNLAANYNNIALLLNLTAKPSEALKAFESALVIRQALALANPTVTQFQSELAISHNNIGALLRDTGKLAEALKAQRSALQIQEALVRANPAVTQLQSNLATSHTNVGLLLSANGQPVEALEAYKSALGIQEALVRANPAVTEFQSDLATTHTNIGILLINTGMPAEALKAFESALAIQQTLALANPTYPRFQSDLATSHSNIGALLRDTGRSAESLKAHELAMVIRRTLAREYPKIPEFSSNLGSTLNNMSIIDLEANRFEEARVRLREAVEWQRKALASNPANPNYRRFLSSHLGGLVEVARRLGDAEGVAQAERELAAVRSSDPAMLTLDDRLGAILRGDEQPNDNLERLQLAQRAYDKALHAAAAKLWADALDADPKLVESRQAGHRYNAACSAALAGCGQGKDEPAPDDAARAKLREQARAWLGAELAAWSKLVDSGPAAVRPVIVQTLQHWREDGDLAGIREAKMLETLPEAERAGYRTLWAEVDALLARAQAAPKP